MRSLLLALLLSGCVQGFVPTPRIISMNPRVVNNLQFLYLTTQVGGQREFVYCLYGEIQGDTMFVERLELPYMNLSNGSNTHANYEDADCKGPMMLGTGHSHPPGYTCNLSDTDWTTFREARRLRFAFLTCQGRMLLVFNRGEIPEVEDGTATAGTGKAHPGRLREQPSPCSRADGAQRRGMGEPAS